MCVFAHKCVCFYAVARIRESDGAHTACSTFYLRHTAQFRANKTPEHAIAQDTCARTCTCIRTHLSRADWATPTTTSHRTERCERCVCLCVVPGIELCTAARCLRCVETDAKIARSLGFTAGAAAARTLTSTQFVHVDTFSARCQACKMRAYQPASRCPCAPSPPPPPHVSCTRHVARTHVSSNARALALAGFALNKGKCVLV